MSSEQRSGIRRLGAIGKRWTAPADAPPEIRAILEPYPRWWPTPGWAWSWFRSGYDRARWHDGETLSTSLVAGFKAVYAAWIWATRK